MIDMIGFPEYILNRTRLDSEYKGVSINCIMPFLVEKKHPFRCESLKDLSLVQDFETNFQQKIRLKMLN